MPKNSPFTPSQLEHIHALTAEVERRRTRPFSEADVQRIMEDMQSPDEMTRVRAVREICPCRMPWEVFDRLRSAAKRLQKDPSALVRANARHIEEDARHVASVEAAKERYQEYQEVEEERQAAAARQFRRGGKGRR